MRRFLRLWLLLAALAVATSAGAQDKLTLNQTYRDVIRLDFPAGKTLIPLPEGEWELLGLQEDQGTEGTRISCTSSSSSSMASLPKDTRLPSWAS